MGPCGIVGRGAVAALLLCLITPALVSAQGADNPHGRQLNGHRFIPSAAVPSPFITTDIGNQVGVGMARNVTTVVGDLNDDPILLTGDVTFIGLGFRYQQALGSWIAARVSVSGRGRLGTDVEALAQHRDLGHGQYQPRRAGPNLEERQVLPVG
jgi:hypothetical protein